MLVDAGASSEVGKDGGVWVDGLVIAAERGHGAVVEMLLSVGVSVDSVDSMEATALCRACLKGNAHVVRVLVDQGGADVNRCGSRNLTPLAWASGWGHEDVVRVLLEAGADVGIVSADGDTAMDLAEREGYDGVVELLKAHRQTQ